MVRQTKTKLNMKSNTKRNKPLKKKTLTQTKSKNINDKLAMGWFGSDDSQTIVPVAQFILMLYVNHKRI